MKILTSSLHNIELLFRKLYGGCDIRLFMNFVADYGCFKVCAPADSKLIILLKKGSLHEGVLADDVVLFWRLLMLYHVSESLFTPYRYGACLILNPNKLPLLINLSHISSSFGGRMLESTNLLLKVLDLPNDGFKFNVRWDSTPADVRSAWLTKSAVLMCVFFMGSNSRGFFLAFKKQRSGVIIYGDYTDFKYKDFENIGIPSGYNLCISYSFFEMSKNYVGNNKCTLKSPTRVDLTGDVCNAYDLLVNDNYSSPLFIHKGDVVDYNKLEGVSKVLRMPSWDEINNVLNVINGQNSIEVCADLDLLRIYDDFSYIRDPYYDIISYNVPMEYVCDEKYFHIPKEVNRDVEKIIGKVIRKVENVECSSELKKYLNFYLRHDLDQRYRVYNGNTPVNYQLNHMVRSLIMLPKVSSDSDHLIYEQFERDIALRFDLEVGNVQFFDFESIEMAVRLRIVHMIQSTYSKGFDYNAFKDYADSCNWHRYFDQALICQTFVDVLVSLSPKGDPNFTRRVVGGIPLYYEVLGIAKHKKCIKTSDYGKYEEIGRKLGVSKRKFYSGLGYILGVSEWLCSDDKLVLRWVGESDACANALELLALRTFNTNEECLKLLNIYDNTSPYADIYSYVVANIKDVKNVDADSNIGDVEWGLILVEIARDLIKSIIMPGTYGQKETTAKDKIRKWLRASKYDISNDKINSIATKIYVEVGSILESLGFGLLSNIEIVKEIARIEGVNYIWSSDLGWPVVCTRYKAISAKETIKKFGDINTTISAINLILGNENYREAFTDKKLSEFVKSDEFSTEKYLVFSEALAILSKNIPKSGCEVRYESNFKYRLRSRLEKLLLKKKSLGSMYIRREVEVNVENKLVKIRPPMIGRSLEINFDKIVNGSVANPTHQRDGSIAIRSLKLFQYYGICALSIHDCMATTPHYNVLSRLIYKGATLEAIELDIDMTPFPYDLLDKVINIEDKGNTKRIRLRAAAMELKRKIGENKEVYKTKRFKLGLLNSKYYIR